MPWECYTTSVREAKQHGWNGVPDANLLLRYLEGSATRDHVEGAAERRKAEQTAIAKLETELEAAREEHYVLGVAYEQRLGRIRIAAQSANDAMRGAWLCRSVRAHLENILSEC